MDTVKVIQAGPLSGEWVIWKKPIPWIGNKERVRVNLDHLVLYVLRPNDYAELKEKQASAQTGVTHYNISGGVAQFGDGNTSITQRGNFSNSNININSKLTSSRQIIGVTPHLEPAEKDELAGLIDQLHSQLQEASGEEVKKAEQVAKRLESVLQELEEPEVEKQVVKDKTNHFLEAAKNISGAMPTVLTLAQQIAPHLSKFF